METGGGGSTSRGLYHLLGIRLDPCNDDLLLLPGPDCNRNRQRLDVSCLKPPDGEAKLGEALIYPG